MVNKAYNAKECYDLGSKAKRLGWMRVTPFYEQERASYWWLTGYDAIDFDVAADKQPEFMQNVTKRPLYPFPIATGETISAEQARNAGLPIPEGVDQVQFHATIEIVDVCIKAEKSRREVKAFLS